ncbi:hypothetical protein LLEC1_07894 [Akanthomyces lecanii]|uniref:N-acetyltransferase domain-containing protein n=1 Tax=Cordyceps confragosa TaxID=2714763 RepID=A0A179IMM8_CORDF|nr:hypothetical protein LLEC1_07894 [Akanthomyces lecanii]
MVVDPRPEIDTRRYIKTTDRPLRQPPVETTHTTDKIPFISKTSRIKPYVAHNKDIVHPESIERMANAKQIRIQRETECDAPVIEEVTAVAFMDAEHAGHNEQFIVRGLREANQLTISLVAEDEATLAIVGHVAVSPVTISDGSESWYGLGPISVRPEHQGRGIGSLLMERALADLQTSHAAAGCVVLGDPKYYTRFGFKADPSLRFPGAPAVYFMALAWREPAPSGTVSFHEAFEATG